MRHPKISKDEFISDLRDICLELTDDNKVSVSIHEQDNTIVIRIKKLGDSAWDHGIIYSEIEDVIERIKDYSKITKCKYKADYYSGVLFNTLIEMRIELKKKTNIFRLLLNFIKNKR